MSMIKDLFPDNLLATTKLDPNTVPGLTNNSLMGPSIFNGLSLEQVSKGIAVADNNTEKADQARPTVLANTSSFATSVNYYVQLTANKLTNTEMKRPGYQDYLEWQGLAAALALRNIYSVKGLDLSIMPVKLNAANLVDACILYSMAKDEAYQYAVDYNALGQPVSGTLFYFCQKGVPFALFHPEIGICPKKDYDRSIFEGILDWYDSSSGWKNLLDPGKPDSYIMEKFYLNRLAWWLSENGLTAAYNKCLASLPNYNHNFYTGLKGDALVGAALIDQIAKNVTLPGASQTRVNALWGNKGSKVLTACMAYHYNGQKLPLPTLYTDKLFLAAISKEVPSRLIYNVTNGVETRALDIGFTNNSGYPDLDSFCPVAPFTMSGAEVLATQCKLTNLRFVPEAQTFGLIAVNVEASVQTPDGEVVTIKHRYTCENIMQGSLPYAMVWPCVELPEDSWHQYYATWTDPYYSPQNLLKDTSGKLLTMRPSNLMQMQMNVGTKNIVNRASATGQNKWTVWYSDKQFDYAALSCLKQANGIDSDMLGVIFVPYKRPIKAGDPAAMQVTTPTILAVDFGTTSTVVSVKPTTFIKPKELTYSDYSCTITVEDADAKNKVMKHHWLGTDKEHNGKLFSVAQLFTRADGTTGPNPNVITAAGNNRYYVDGRMFVVSGALLTEYAANSFDAQQIYNDMKFSATTNPVYMHAAAIFLAGLYQYAMLYLLSNYYVPVAGVDYVTLYASYPNDVTRSSLQQSWQYAQNILSDTLSGELLSPLDAGAICYRTEAQATTVYNLNPNRAVQIPHMISVDIGGGTTDIALKNLQNILMGAPDSGNVKQLSIRYAGREMMVESLVECYRRYADETIDPTAMMGKTTAFSNLWSAVDMTNLITQFVNTCQNAQNQVALGALVKDSTLRQFVECLLAGGMDIGDPALKSEHRILRQTITLKFGMLMLTLAQIIARNIEIWNDSNGKLAAPGNILSLDMVVSGTSAQLLKYVFNCNLGDLDNKNYAAAVALPNVQAGIGIINDFIEYIMRETLGKDADTVMGEKGTANEIHVDFTFHVNPDVALKQEVSFGMIEMKMPHGAAYDYDPHTPPVAAAAPTAVPAATPTGRFGHFGGGAAGASAATTMNPAVKAALRQQRQTKATNCIMNSDYTALQNFINGDLATFVRLFDTHVAPYPSKCNVSPLKINGQAENDLPTMLSNFTEAEFTQVKMSTATAHSAYMCEEEQEPYLDVLARLYLVDELFNYQMTKYQQ